MKHCVFPMICGSRGSKSRLAKAAGAEPAGQMRDEKLHAAVARSTFRSQNVQLLEIEMSKKCTPLWREAHVEVKMYKTRHARTTLRHVEVNVYKTHQLRTTFGSCDHMLGPLFDVQMSFLVAGARDCAPCQK